MHPITVKDVQHLYKYNLKNEPYRFLKSFVQNEDKEFYRAWVKGEKVFLRKGKTDILVFKKIFIDQEYNFNLRHEVRTIIDAGANIGLSALYFATKFPAAKIVAVEPEISNFELMKRNVAPYPNIYPLLGGVSNESGRFKIKNTAGDHWNFMLEPGDAGGNDGMFYTVSEIMDRYTFDAVDFFKIDIEGGEETLFKSHLHWLKKVKALSIELHDFILPHSSNAFFKALVTNEPYSYFVYGENHLVVFDH